MTYVLDLQRLWYEAEDTSEQTASPELRKNVVSAIVVAEEDEEKLILTIQSVLVQQLVREVIIVNCGNSAVIEKSLIKFTSLHSKCYIVNGQKRMGLASAYNLGAQYASGQYLLFLNANSILPKNTVMKLLTTGLRKPTPWVIGVQERRYAPSTQKIGIWAKLSGKARSKISVPSYEDSKMQVEVSLAGGGFHAANVAPECLFIPTQAFLDLKGMDKKCFHSTFHRDLCLRVHLAGGGVYRARDLNLVIEQNSSLPLGMEIYRQWQAFKGIVHFYKKYVSNNTNIFLVAMNYLGLTLKFLGNFCFSLFSFVLPRTAKAPTLEKRRCLT